MIKHLLLYISLFTFFYGFNQTVNVYGKITDDKNRALEGAEIKVSSVRQKIYTNSKC